MRDLVKNASLYFGIHAPASTEDFFSARRNVLYSRILVMAAAVAFFTFIKDVLDQGVAPIPLMDFLLFIVIIVAFVFNKLGRPVPSRVILLLLLNGLLTVMCSVIPPDRVAFVYFFPMIIIAYMIFDDSQKVWKWTFVFLPMALMVVLILSDFKLLGDHQLSLSTHGQRNMVINQITSALILFLCFDFMIRTNKKSEHLLRAYAIDAGEKKENLEKINSELDRFVYSASHDLRSPLLSIQGLVRIALAEPDSTNDKKYFELIGDRVTKLDEFIKEIIEYSRNSRTEVVHELVNLKELIGDVVSHLQYLDGTDKIEVYISSADESLLLDKGRTRIILSNILGNAIKYHNLRQENPWVEVKTELKEGFCVITITDNGTGIPSDKQDRIFDMFFRATDRSAGSGLGLFIVKETVMKLNGKIGVKSEYGRGSEFVVTLPLQK
ncbi:MAG: hypothetical protein C0523_02435 [Cytophaga sp.]|nr:hypothetical protein [Cytophaga sp.]